MRTRLTALSLALAFATPAVAQSNVIIDGRVDAGFLFQDKPQDPASLIQSSGHREAIDQGLWTHSRLRFRGTEELGNGWKAMFWLENRVLVDTGGSSPRQHWVALASKDYGMLQLGRINTPSFDWLMLFDASGANAFRYVNPGLYDTGESWADNAVQYTSPLIGGFEFAAYYSDEWMGSEDGDANKSYGGNLRYANGPLHAIYNLQKFKTYDFLATRFPSGEYHTLAANYDLGVVKLFGTVLYNAYDDAALERTRQWSLGVSVPVGANGVFTAGYGTQADLRGVAGEDRDTVGLTYRYNLSKRSFTYVGYQLQDLSDRNRATRLEKMHTYGAGMVHYF